ncbi:MAG TPA: DUF1080 domain-containing protein [Bryobacteraceae bacterium]
MTIRFLEGACLAVACSGLLMAQQAWRQHDMTRPNPSVVTPAAKPGGAPSDAVVLFDGKSLGEWEGRNGGPAQWTVKDGYFQVKPGTGNIHTKQKFGDCQLHIEWASPNPPKGTGQMRGNSGVILMGTYELQVLDSYHARTYADGQAGALYGQYPPLVNATRPPGDWQTYDIVFRQPRFDKHGRLISRARETVFQNGVLVQDATPLTGPTAYHNRPPYYPLPMERPLALQDHGTLVRYRNVWVRKLPPGPEALPDSSFVPLRPDPKLNAEYAGTYEGGNITMTILDSGGNLTAKIATKARTRANGATYELTPKSDDLFWGRALPGMDLIPFYFTRGYKSRESPVRTAVVFLGGRYIELTKK